MTQHEIMSLKDIQKGLKDKRLYVVATATGLSYPTLKKLANNQDPNPTRETMLKVTNYLRGE